MFSTKMKIFILLTIIVIIVFYIFSKYIISFLLSKLGMLSWFLLMLTYAYDPNPSGMKIIENSIPITKYQSTKEIVFYMKNEPFDRYPFDTYESDNVFSLRITDKNISKVPNNIKNKDMYRRIFEDIYMKLPVNSILTTTGEIFINDTYRGSSPTQARGIVNNKTVWFAIEALNCFDMYDGNYSRKEHMEIMKKVSKEPYNNIGCNEPIK